MDQKNILIFGVNGLVGSSSLRVLSEENSFNITPSNRKDTDLFDYSATKRTIDTVNPDIIINAAAKVGGILANNTQRTEFILENLKINMNILESCINRPKTKIINLGSSCIYPLNAPNPIKESSFMEGKLEETNSPYAMAKITAIEIGNSLKKQFGHSVVNLMPTNLYGPNDNFNKETSHVIPGLIRRMHESKLNKDSKFQVWGDGSPLREFLYVDDLSLAIKFIIENDIKNELVNVGFGEEITIKELAKKLKNVVSYEGERVFDTSKPNGNPRKLLDTTVMQNLGWSPKFKLDEGLVKTYEWYLSNL